MADCKAEVELAIRETVVLTLGCSLSWPHLDQPHTAIVQWLIDPDDATLALLDDELDDPDDNVLEVPHVVVEPDETGPSRDG